MDNTSLISIFSLVIAVLAVFVGPYISIKIAKRQSENSLKIANKQLISPIRQNWINELRKLVSEILSISTLCKSEGLIVGKRPNFYRLLELKGLLTLYLNPKERDHSELITTVDGLVKCVGIPNSEDEINFNETQNQIVIISQKILKREWERVKFDT
ncbi:MAG: hypothetical protein CVU66_00675 [Deltaproteobacteria bacterium HGW-Deltaproteobacteria-23]|nr:MAG: hypothetical protein CVU66_00675 [Deltaproteobacteria bacterium HGW-Deltaproteobacteria-23]